MSWIKRQARQAKVLPAVDFKRRIYSLPDLPAVLLDWLIVGDHSLGILDTLGHCLVRDLDLVIGREQLPMSLSSQ